MKDDSKSSKDIESNNNEIGNYFEMECDRSFSSYGNMDNDSRYAYNNDDSLNEENKVINQNKHNQIDDYINNNMIPDNNFKINQTTNIANANNNNNSKIIKSSSAYNLNDDLNIKNNLNNNISNFNSHNNNNNNNSKKRNNSNINNIIDEKSNNNMSNSKSINFNNINNNPNNLKKLDDELSELLFFHSISNNNINNNLNNNIKNDINKNDKKEKTEAKVIDNLSLSSSSNDVQIVSSEEFRKHFQEDKYGTQRKIEVIQDKNPLNMPFSQYNDKLKTHINNNRNYVSQFFADNNNNNLSKKNNKINGIKPKINNINSLPNIDIKKKFIKKRKKFSPLPKDKYRDNRVFHKLLINRLEKQILTDIYNEYQNKEDFEETYYYIEKIKYLINEKGVEDAMKYLETIEPISLRTKIIIESTFFFKQIVKEEVEFAKNNDGRLILYKQPDFIFNQNLKYNSPLSGKVNQNHDHIKRGKSCGKFNDEKLKNKNTSNNIINDKNGNGNIVYYSNFNKNPYMYISQNSQKKLNK